MAKELIYVYCVCQSQPNFRDSDSGDNVHTVGHQGLYAIVSKVAEDEFGEANLKKNLANLDWIKEKASAHERIIENIMKQTGVIPFKFATIFKTEDNLKAMLNEHAQDFKTNLKNLQGKEEWGVKIYCDIGRLKESVVKQDMELLIVEKEINSTSCGKAYLLKKKKEQLLKDALNKRINEYGQESFETLKRLSFRTRINKLLPKEVTEKTDQMILNSAFLIDKNRILEFIQAADGLKEKFSGQGLNFDCTGPWPPYNFCTNG